MSLRKSALSVLLTAGVMGFLPVAWGQEQPIVEVPNARNTVVGEVTASGVNVRSGPAESYYPTMRLNKGDKVTVVGHKFEWLKITPPQGSFSYVAKLYIDRDGAAATGKVNRDDVLVRAGSTLNAEKAQPQTKLGRGASVEIVGEAGEYYKIAPPEGAYLYVAKQFVGQAGSVPAVADAAVAPGASAAAVAVPEVEMTVGQAQLDAGNDAKPQETSTDIVETPAKQPDVPVAKPEQVKPARPTETVNAGLETDFRKLEHRFAQIKDQPLEEQPIAALLAGYQELQNNQQLSGTSRRMSSFRVKYLQALEKQQEQLKTAKQEEADFVARQAQSIEQQRAIEQRMKEQGIAVYSAVGQLQTSSIQKDGAPMMRLVDPADSRTLIYIRTADAGQRAMVGQFVGVRGEVAQDSQLSVDYIEPAEMVQVDPAQVLKGITAKIYPSSFITRATQQ